MLRTTLEGLRAHPLRLVLTSLVIVLSIGFTAGTLVLTDSLDRAGTDAVAASAREVDLSVRSSADRDTGFDRATIDEIAGIDGVAASAARATTGVRGVDGDGRIDPNAYAMVTAVPADAALAAVTLQDGRLPDADDEAVLDTATAERDGLAIGDTYAVAPWDGEPRSFTIVGIASSGPGTVGTVLSTTYDAVQTLADSSGAERIDVRLDDGAEAEAVRAAMAAASGGSAVLTGAELTDVLVDESSSPAKALRVPLLVLGAVALIVAAFVIANTFRILVAQRTRELALLRTVGATRGQVMAGVLIESVVVGVVGSVLGILLGAVAAIGIGTLISDGGRDLPLVVAPSTIVASLVVGLVVTVGSALLPARAATRVAPLAAVRALPDGADDRRAGKRRIIGGALLVIGGLGLLLMGASAGANGSTLGLVLVVLGAAVSFLGVLVLGPAFVPPMVKVLGAAGARLAGSARRTTTDLATANAVRNPRRIAATSAALLIGVTMVAGFTTVATSARESAGVIVDQQFPSDFTVQSSGGEVIPADVSADIEELDETGPTVPMYENWADVEGMGSGVDIHGMDLRAVDAMSSLDGEGDLDDLESGTVAVGSVIAERHGVGLGDTVVVTTPAGPRELTVGYVIGDSILAVVVAPEIFGEMFPEIDGPSQIAVDAADGADVETARAAVISATDGLTGVSVQNLVDAREDLDESLDQVIGVVLAILGLAVVIAVIGIANTMSLSVHERTREIGLLRALGLTRAQTRSMLGIEAVLMSVLAAVVGVVVGVFFAWAAITSVPDLSMTIPWGQIVACAVGAGVLGLLASVVPGRRAAATSPVVALATE